MRMGILLPARSFCADEAEERKQKRIIIIKCFMISNVEDKYKIDARVHEDMNPLYDDCSGAWGTHHGVSIII
jgi:hypothetical protein